MSACGDPTQHGKPPRRRLVAANRTPARALKRVSADRRIAGHRRGSAKNHGDTACRIGILGASTIVRCQREVQRCLDQQIIASTTAKNIEANTAIERVVSFKTLQRIVAAEAKDRVVPVHPLNTVGTAIAGDHVVEFTAAYALDIHDVIGRAKAVLDLTRREIGYDACGRIAIVGTVVDAATAIDGVGPGGASKILETATI